MRFLTKNFVGTISCANWESTIKKWILLAIKSKNQKNAYGRGHNTTVEWYNASWSFSSFVKFLARWLHLILISDARKFAKCPLHAWRFVRVALYCGFRRVCQGEAGNTFANRDEGNNFQWKLYLVVNCNCSRWQLKLWTRDSWERTCPGSDWRSPPWRCSAIRTFASCCRC